MEVWSPEIGKSYMRMKKANIQWCEAGKPKSICQLTIQRKLCKQEFRRAYRTELAIRDVKFKEKIMSTRTKDSKLFHQLLNKQRATKRGFILDLNIDGETISGNDMVLKGFRDHFRKLAIPQEDQDYNYENNKQTEYEIDIITELAKLNNIEMPTLEEIQEALKDIKRGKSQDIYELSIENFIYGGDELLNIIKHILSAIFTLGEIPDILKQGWITNSCIQKQRRRPGNKKLSGYNHNTGIL